MLVKILKVLPLATRPYIDKIDGSQKVFKAKGLLVHTGEGSLYVEGVQEMAELLNNTDIKENDCALMVLSSVARSYKGGDNNERYSNEFLIKSFIML